jgi:3-methyl-2-oxobutanoate hydroxymethyltransferase
MILVGDSLGMVLYGMKTTREVKIETMILHAKAVKQATTKSIVVFDMPYKTYTNKFLAYKNARHVIKLTKCDAIKLEGGKKVSNIIKYLVKKGIPVLAHIGLLPQTSTNYKVKGKSADQKKKIYNDALEISKSGAFAMIIECVVESLSKKITEDVKIPTIGIGASRYCDGQLLVTDDLIGLSEFKSKFVKKYVNLNKIINKTVRKFSKDVKMKRFPTSKNVYK